MMMEGGVYCKDHPDAPLVNDYRTEVQICAECGLAVGDRVINVSSEIQSSDSESESLTFSNENAYADPPFVYGTEDLHLYASDLFTTIGGDGGDEAFDEFEGAESQIPGSSTNTDRPLLNSFGEIAQMADRSNIPRTVQDRANNLFNMVLAGKNLKGRSNDAIASACLYFACRQEGVPRTFKEICAVSKTSTKKIGKCFKLVLKALDKSADVIPTGDFMSRFCSSLNLPLSVQRAATSIAGAAVDLDIVPERSPISVAAAAIYMASQASEQKRNQKEIGDVTGVADVTLGQIYKLLYPRAEELFPKDFKFFTPIEQLPLA